MQLPTELLNQHVMPELGTRISAIRFEDQLCTVRYIGALKSKLYAIMIALTKPISLANIHAHLGISQSLFFNLWNELAEEGQGNNEGPKILRICRKIAWKIAWKQKFTQINLSSKHP